MKLLLINSNSSISRLIKLCCEKYDFHVDEFDGTNLDVITQSDYDIAYIDDEVYNEQLLRALKERHAATSIGVIIPKKSSKPSEADFALHKPFLPADFVEGAVKIRDELPTDHLPDIEDDGIFDNNEDMATPDLEETSLDDLNLDESLELDEESSSLDDINFGDATDDHNSEALDELDDILASIDDGEIEEEALPSLDEEIAEESEEIVIEESTPESQADEEEDLLEEISFDDDLESFENLEESNIELESSDNATDDLNAFDELIDQMNEEDTAPATQEHDTPSTNAQEEDEFDINELSGLLDPDTLSDDEEESILEDDDPLENPLLESDNSVDLHEVEELAAVEEDSKPQDEADEEPLINLEDELVEEDFFEEDTTESIKEMSREDEKLSQELDELFEDSLDEESNDTLSLDDLDNIDDEVALDEIVGEDISDDIDALIQDNDEPPIVPHTTQKEQATIVEEITEEPETVFDINDTEFIDEVDEDALLDSVIKKLADIGLDVEPQIENLDTTNVLDKADVQEIKSLMSGDEEKGAQPEKTTTSMDKFGDLDQLDELDIKNALSEEEQKSVVEEVVKQVQESSKSLPNSDNLDDLLAAAIKEKISKAISEEIVKKALEDMELNITLNFKDTK
jgi:hypothetical protein